MRKKLIRTLTFIFGLYFVLEFLLPKEIGGNFDKSGTRSPYVLRDAESGQYRLFYVGIYDRRNEAVGLATSPDGSTWGKSSRSPVVRSTLFGSADRLGFSSLSAIRTGSGTELYYLGSDMDNLRTICWADSADGVRWVKHGRVEFRGETPWQQQYESEESVARHRYTKIQAVTAAVRDGKRSLFIAQSDLEGKTDILVAKRSGLGRNWEIAPEAISLEGLPDLQRIVSLSYVEKDGTPELWLFFSDQTLFRKSLAPGGGVEQMAFGKRSDEAKAAEEVHAETTRTLPDNITDLTITASAAGYRMWYTRLGRAQAGEEPGSKPHIFSAESQNGSTWYLVENEPLTFKLMGQSFAFPLPQPAPLFAAGKRAQPTYLSRGTVFAGQLLAIIGAFAIGLGAVNMCIVHGRNLVKTRKSVHNSAIFFVCLVGMFVCTMAGKPLADKVREERAKSGQDTAKAQEAVEQLRAAHTPAKRFVADAYDFVFYNLEVSLGTSVFALLSFYMVGAAFRSFRVKSGEALFLVLSAVIVLLGQIPLGAAMTGELPKAKDLLLNLFNAAAYRGVLLGMAIAALSTSLRLWLGLEKGMFHGT